MTQSRRRVGSIHAGRCRSIFGPGATAAAAIAALLGAVDAHAQQQAVPAATSAGENTAGTQLSWPRTYPLPDNQQIQIYQPQIDNWNGDVMSGRAAVAMGPKAGTPTYGMVRFTTRVAVDKPAGLVHFATFTVTGVEVPAAPDKAGVIRTTIQAYLPSDGMTVPLDQLQASYAVNKELAELKTQPVDNTPPKILVADTTTIQVPVAGTPALRPIPGVAGFQRVVNTRPLLLLDEAGTYHLQAAGTWYEATALAGPWLVTPQISNALAAAARAANADLAADPLLDQEGKPIVPPPAILVTTEPAELIQTQGQPQMQPVGETNLLTVTNTDHAVFVETATNTYYVLVAGRWFKAPDLKGPWTFVPADALPKDFARIGPEDPKANVLVSVAGTPQAKEAVIAATIPQTATVKRNVPLNVLYEGSAPKFEAISGTPLAYAVNTPVPVIRLDAQRYYAVADGIWFVAATPSGPWRVADVVPDVIYTIPVASPVHYVTYVRVYGSTPDAVVVGYTPGYMGVIAAPSGTVVYGTGYSCPGYVGSYWVSCPTTYGQGAGFALGVGTGFAFGFAAGFPWGAAVGPYWGPYWAPWGAGPWGPAAWGPGPWGPGPWGGNWGFTNVNQTNVYGRWGGNATVNHAWGTTWNGTGWSGRDWRGTTANGTAFTGRSAAAFNPYSGNWAAGRQGAHVNPATGAAGASRGFAAGNVRSGNAVAGHESAGENPATGIAHAAQTAVTDNHGHVSVDSRGVVTDARTGTSAAWNNGHVVVDHGGNVYRRTDDGWSRNTASGWQNADRTTDTARFDNEVRARSWGQQRVNNIRSDDDFGGDRFGSGGFNRDFGGFGGGDRFGGGFRGGGGFRR